MISKEMRAEVGTTRYAFQFSKTWREEHEYLYRIDFETTDTCNDGSSWAEGAYGNMKIYRRYHNASPIYLLTEEKSNKCEKILKRWAELYHITYEKFIPIQTRVRKKLLEKHADKIIEEV